MATGKVKSLHITMGSEEDWETALDPEQPEAFFQTEMASCFPTEFAARIKHLYLYDIAFLSPLNMRTFIAQFTQTRSLTLENVSGTVEEHSRQEDHIMPLPTLTHCTTVSWDSLPYRWRDCRDIILVERIQTIAVLLSIVPQGVTDLRIKEMEYHLPSVVTLLNAWKDTLEVLELYLGRQEVTPWSRAEYRTKHGVLPSDEYGRTHSPCRERPTLIILRQQTISL